MRRTARWVIAAGAAMSLVLGRAAPDPAGLGGGASSSSRVFVGVRDLGAGPSWWPRLGIGAARAQDTSCTLVGTAPLAKGTQLFDARVGGRVIATFSGTFVPMTLGHIPGDAGPGRGRLRTTHGGASLRLDGFVPLASVPVFTAKDVPVAGGHVWISSAQKTRLVRATGSSLTVELTIAGSKAQTVRGTGSCDAFTLQRGTPTAMDVPGNGRGYLMKSSTLDLFATPASAAAEPVFTLRMMDGAGQLFWSTESKNGHVRVLARGDLTIDAWARARDLEPLKKGEMMDQLLPTQTAVTGAQLTLDKPPRLVRATKEIAVRARRDEKDKPIGVIEIGAEVYVMETVAGWSNILPKSLAMTPPDDGGFWIPAAETPR